MKNRLYIAYGSNLNLEQMKRRCPTAEVMGKTILRGWSLWFRGSRHSAVATIERKRGGKVPVLVWKIQPRDEASLDRYEGVPHFYHKETLRIAMDGQGHNAMVYIMNPEHEQYGTPSEHYLEIIREGYESAGFDQQILDDTVKNSEEAAQ